MRCLLSQIGMHLRRAAFAVIAAAFAGLPAHAEPITISVGPFVTATLFQIADDEGYFKDEKLDVKLVGCLGAFQCMKDTLDGKTHYGTGGDIAVMFHALQRRDFAVLANFSNSTSIVKILARKDARIRSTADFVGKRVGYIRKTAVHYYMDIHLLSAGVNPKQVNQIPLEPNEMAEALAKGTVDAIFTFEPLASRQRAELGELVADVPVPSTYSLGTNLLSLRAHVEARREEAVKLLQALYRAEQYLQKHPEKAKQIWASHSKIGLSDADTVWKTTSFKLRLDHSLITTLRASARWAKDAGLVEVQEIPDFRAVIEPGPLRKVLPHRVGTR